MHRSDIFARLFFLLISNFSGHFFLFLISIASYLGIFR